MFFCIFGLFFFFFFVGGLKHIFFISVFQQADGVVLTLGAAQTRTSVFEEGGERDCKSGFLRYTGRVCVWLYKIFFVLFFFLVLAVTIKVSICCTTSGNWDVFYLYFYRDTVINLLLFYLFFLCVFYYLVCNSSHLFKNRSFFLSWN